MPVDNKKVIFADSSEARAGLYSDLKVVHENNTLTAKKRLRESTVRLINRTLDLKTPNAGTKAEQTTAVRYERHSLQQAITNRYALAEAMTTIGSDSAAFLFRLYGRFGLGINEYLRENPKRFPNPRSSSRRQTSKRHVARNMPIFSTVTGISNADDIRTVNPDRVHYLLADNSVSYTIGIGLDEIIRDHQVNFKYSDHTLLYRVSRAKEYVFSLEYQNGIQVGDTIVDKAFTSTGSDMESILYRYSTYETAATQNVTYIHPSEEEVIFVIEANRHLKAANISGYKFSPDGYGNKISSGEILVQSRQLFRVAAIAPKRSTEQSRVVFLEPHETPPTHGEIYRNPFNGHPVMPEDLFDDVVV